MKINLEDKTCVNTKLINFLYKAYDIPEDCQASMIEKYDEIEERNHMAFLVMFSMYVEHTTGKTINLKDLNGDVFKNHLSDFLAKAVISYTR